jgi:hypothetical protein
MTPIQGAAAPETRPRQATQMSDDVPAAPDLSAAMPPTTRTITGTATATAARTITGTATASAAGTAARTGTGRPMPEPVQRGTQASVAAVRRLGRRLPRR